MKDLIIQFIPDLSKVIIELMIVYFVIKFGPFYKTKELKLSEEEVDAIVNDFEPEEIISLEYEDISLYEESKYELADYDVFNLKNQHKLEIKKIISDYGVGTCGPRGFYGTLDLHLELEKELCILYEREGAVLYSNAFTCINSVISCFCKSNDVIFYNRNSNAAILRGISFTKSKSVEFSDFNDLEEKIKAFSNKNRNNFLIAEGISVNEGIINDLNELIKIRNKYKIRIILDEGNSFPILGKKGIFSFFNIHPKEVDIIIGSFSNYLCSNGGFVISDAYLADYQRLSSASYCFSASLPAFQTYFNSLTLKKDFSFESIRNLNEYFIGHFTHSFLKIISPKDSPFILISYEESDSKLKDIKFIRNELLVYGVRVGIIEYPRPSIKLFFKNDYEKEDINEIIRIIGMVEEPALSESETE